jgi:hypothetical protein
MRLSDDLVELETEKLHSIIDVADTPDEKTLWENLLKACTQGRRTGLGTHGLADAIARLTLSYDSTEALEIIAKIYETYVGHKDFQPEDPIFDILQSVGQEYGATTGRPRQCNWLNWDSLEKAIKINGVNHLVFNKTDILQQIRTWKIRHHNEIFDFSSEDEMKNWIFSKLSNLDDINLHFSSSPNHL